MSEKYTNVINECHHQKNLPSRTDAPILTCSQGTKQLIVTLEGSSKSKCPRPLHIYLFHQFSPRKYCLKRTPAPPPQYSKGGPLKQNGNSVVHESDSEGVSNIYFVLAIVPLPVYRSVSTRLLDSTGA